MNRSEAGEIVRKLTERITSKEASIRHRARIEIERKLESMLAVQAAEVRAAAVLSLAFEDQRYGGFTMSMQLNHRAPVMKRIDAALRREHQRMLEPLLKKTRAIREKTTEFEITLLVLKDPEKIMRQVERFSKLIDEIE